MNGLSLPSGPVASPHERLMAFCEAEYLYYDAIPSVDPRRHALEVVSLYCR